MVRGWQLQLAVLLGLLASSSLASFKGSSSSGAMLRSAREDWQDGALLAQDAARDIARFWASEYNKDAKDQPARGGHLANIYKARSAQLDVHAKIGLFKSSKLEAIDERFTRLKEEAVVAADALVAALNGIYSETEETSVEAVYERAKQLLEAYKMKQAHQNVLRITAAVVNPLMGKHFLAPPLMKDQLSASEQAQKDSIDALRAAATAAYQATQRLYDRLTDGFRKTAEGLSQTLKVKQQLAATRASKQVQALAKSLQDASASVDAEGNALDALASNQAAIDELMSLAERFDSRLPEEQLKMKLEALLPALRSSPADLTNALEPVSRTLQAVVEQPADLLTTILALDSIHSASGVTVLNMAKMAKEGLQGSILNED